MESVKYKSLEQEETVTTSWESPLSATFVTSKLLLNATQIGIALKMITSSCVLNEPTLTPCGPDTHPQQPSTDGKCGWTITCHWEALIFQIDPLDLYEVKDHICIGIAIVTLHTSLHLATILTNFSIKQCAACPLGMLTYTTVTQAKNLPYLVPICTKN